MGRLTVRLKDGCARISTCMSCDTPLENCEIMHCNADIEVVKALAAYEDTNLTPERVAELAAQKEDGGA